MKSCIVETNNTVCSYSYLQASKTACIAFQPLATLSHYPTHKTASEAHRFMDLCLIPAGSSLKGSIMLIKKICDGKYTIVFSDEIEIEVMP